MAQRKQFIPGSIFVRKGTNKLTLKYNGKQIATGLNDTPHGRKVAQDMLQQIHFETINYSQTTAIRAKNIFGAFEMFITDHCKGLEEKTIVQYKIAFHTITPKDYPITDERINGDILHFTKEYAKKVKQSTITNYLRHYSVFVNYCLRKEFIQRFPDKLRSERKISKKFEKKKEVIVFERAEIDSLVEYFRTKDVEFSLLLRFLWHTGGRISETLKLEWSQIDMKQRRIRYANKINIGDDDYLPISSSVESILNELRGKNGNKVFRWSYTTKSRLNRKLNAAMVVLGIDKQERGFHAIRRTFATNLIENNISLADVKDLMRHKDIKTTLEHYKAKKGQRLEAILEKNVV